MYKTIEAFSIDIATLNIVKEPCEIKFSCIFEKNFKGLTSLIIERKLNISQNAKFLKYLHSYLNATAPWNLHQSIEVILKLTMLLFEILYQTKTVKCTSILFWKTKGYMKNIKYHVRTHVMILRISAIYVWRLEIIYFTFVFNHLK